MKLSISAFAVSCLFAFVPFPSVMAQVNVLTYHNSNSRTGQNLNETNLTPANVNSATFGKLFTYNVDGYVFAQPLYVSGLNIPGQGIYNVIFIATEHNSVYAFDADSPTGPSNGLLWKTNLGISAVTPNADFGTRYGGGYTDISPEVGITGTPVIDLASGTLYLDSFTHEGSAYFHRLHALNIRNGNEQSNSPVLVSASVPGTGVGSTNGVLKLEHMQHLQRGALTLAGGILYVLYTGYADTNPYHGWIVGFDPNTLQRLTNFTFNTTPNSTIANSGPNAGEGGIWMGGNGLAVDANTNLYFEVGNGIFTATNGTGGTEYGDSFMRLSTTNSRLTVADYFTPYNQFTLAANDTDLGSGGLMLLPDQLGNYPHLLVGAGKQGTIYLINRDQMTTGNNHYNPPPSTTDSIVQRTAAGTIAGGGSFSTPSYLNGKIYWAGSGDKLKAFSMTLGSLSSTPVGAGTRIYGFPGATTSVSANGTFNGIVWAIQKANPAVLVAYDPANLTNEMYNTTQAAANRDQLTNGVRFAVPTIANGKVYVGGTYAVSVLGLLGGTFAFNSPTYTVPEAAGTATITVNRAAGTQGAVQVSYATVVGGTAVSGVDYNSTSGILNWANGDAAPKSFNVTVLDNDQGEPNKTVNLALSAPSSSAYLGGQSTAVLTILEDFYDLWRFSHFGPNSGNPAIAGDFADPDGDGVLNLMEFALAADPNVANTNRSPAAAISGNHFQIYFHRNTAATNLTYVVESSGSLTGWSPAMTYTAGTGWVANMPGAVASESGPVGVQPDQYVNVAIDVGAPSAASRFLRLRVHR